MVCVGNTRSIFKTSPIRNDGMRGMAFPPCPAPASALPAASIHHVFCNTDQVSAGTGCSTHVLCSSHPSLSWAPVLSCRTGAGNRSGVEWGLFRCVARTELYLAPSVPCCLEILAQGCNTKGWVSDLGVSTRSVYHSFLSPLP